MSLPTLDPSSPHQSSDTNLSRPAQIEAKLQTWRGRRAARQKHWQVVFRAYDDLCASGAQCRLLCDDVLVSGDELERLVQRFGPDADESDVDGKAMSPMSHMKALQTELTAFTRGLRPRQAANYRH